MSSLRSPPLANVPRVRPLNFPSAKSLDKSRMGSTMSSKSGNALSFAAKIKKYREVFDTIDTDKSGALSADEFAQAIFALGVDESSMETAFSQGEEVTFERFVELMEHYEQELSVQLLLEEQESEEEEESSGDDGAVIPHDSIDAHTAQMYKRIFTELDVKRCGRLSSEEMHTYIRNQSLREASMTPEELNFYFALIEAADNSPDGTIDIDGFAAVAEFHPDYFNQVKHQQKKNVSRLKISSRGSAQTDDSSVSRSKLNKQDLMLFQQVFDAFDQDQDGFVTDTDVTMTMNSLGRIPTEDESEFMFELLQIVGEGGFAFEQYVDLMLDAPEFIVDLGKSVKTWQRGNQKVWASPGSFSGLKPRMSRQDFKAVLERGSSNLKPQEMFQRIQNQNSQVTGRRVQSRNNSRFSGLVRATPSRPNFSVAQSRQMSRARGPTAVATLNQLLSPLELLRYQTVFNALDLDRDGHIRFSELSLSIKSVIGRQPSDQELREFLSDSDGNGNGTIEFDEFVTIMLKTKRVMNRATGPTPDFQKVAEERKMDKYRQVFDSFDTNKDGRITPDELKTSIAAMGKNMDEALCTSVFQTYDKNKSGGLEFEEFVPLMDHLIAKELNL